MARPSKTEIAQKRTLRLRPRFCRQAQRFQQFSVALVCHFSLLLCTTAANNNGEARHGENAHFGSERTFVDRHSGLSIFAFASLRRARYFSPQAQWFMQFFAALVCHFSLLLCTSAANNNGDANNAQHAHFGSDRTFVDRQSGFNIFLRVAFVSGRSKKGQIQIWQLKASETHFLLMSFLLAEPGLQSQIFGHARLIVAKSCNFVSGVLTSGPIFADRRDRRKINHRACRQKLGLIWGCLNQKQCF